MAYRKKYNTMSIVDLISVCLVKEIDYHDGGTILNADEIRTKLGKKEHAEVVEV